MIKKNKVFKKQVEIFGLNITNLTKKETILKIEDFIIQRTPKLIVTPNVHHINILQKDYEFSKVYSKAAMVLPDSTPLIFASRILRQPIKERVTGSDLLPLFCNFAAKKKYKLFFLGAEPGIAARAARILEEKYPGLRVTGTYSPPYGFEQDKQENLKIIKMIKITNPDVLFVGLGAPKQEKWALNYKEKLSVPVTICVGAAFDFISMKLKRAPLWMQRFGLEWLHRCIQEPNRLLRRYIAGNTKFLWLFLKELLIKRK